MGLLPRLQKAHVGTRRISFVGPDGTPIAAMQPESLTGGAEGLDLEVLRGDLADALYAPLKRPRRVPFRRLDRDTERSRRSGRGHLRQRHQPRTFDLVIGADGLHSNTRWLVFGREERFHRYMGKVFAGFTLTNDFGLSHEGVIWNVPGRAAVLYAHEAGPDVHGFLTFRQEEPPYDAFRNPQAQRELVAARFPEQGWHMPRLVTGHG